MIVNQEEFYTAYHDFTGWFPVKSRQRNEYLLVRYYHDVHLNIVVPINNCAVALISDAWVKLNKTYTKSGVAQAAYILYNEM